MPDLHNFDNIDIMKAPDDELYTLVDKFREDSSSGDATWRQRAFHANNYYNS